MRWPSGRTMLTSNGMPTTPLDAIAAQIDYVAERVGIEHVCLGSDFDGAVTPHALNDAAQLYDLLATLRARGHDDASLRQIASENWLRVLERTWKSLSS